MHKHTCTNLAHSHIVVMMCVLKDRWFKSNVLVFETGFEFDKSAYFHRLSTHICSLYYLLLVLCLCVCVCVLVQNDRSQYDDTFRKSKFWRADIVLNKRPNLFKYVFLIGNQSV